MVSVNKYERQPRSVAATVAYCPNCPCRINVERTQSLRLWRKCYLRSTSSTKARLCCRGGRRAWRRWHQRWKSNFSSLDSLLIYLYQLLSFSVVAISRLMLPMRFVHLASLLDEVYLRSSRPIVRDRQKSLSAKVHIIRPRKTRPHLTTLQPRLSSVHGGNV